MKKKTTKKTVYTKTTKTFTLQLTRDDIVELCRKAGHDVGEGASITLTEYSHQNTMDYGNPLIVQWTTQEVRENAV